MKMEIEWGRGTTTEIVERINDKNKSKNKNKRNIGITEILE